MKKILFTGILLAAVSSCVPQKKYSDLENNYYITLNDQSRLNKELTLANHNIETLQNDLNKIKKELYIKDTALVNSQKLMNVSQNEFENMNLQLQSALNSSNQKSQTFFNQLKDKEKQFDELSKQKKDLEAKIESQNNEIMNLKKQILIKDIQEKAK